MRTLARFVVRRRHWILGGTVLFLVGAGIFGGSVASHLSVGGFEDPGTESATTAKVLLDRFGVGESDFVLLVTAPRGGVDSPAVARLAGA